MVSWRAADEDVRLATPRHVNKQGLKKRVYVGLGYKAYMEICQWTRDTKVIRIS